MDGETFTLTYNQIANMAQIQLVPGRQLHILRGGVVTLMLIE